MATNQKKFPRQGKLAGKLKQYDVSVPEIAKAVSKSPELIYAIISGHVDYKASIARKIKTYISKKYKVDLTLDDIIE